MGKYPALLYLSIFLSAVGGFLFGYDTGVIAGAMPLIERDVPFWGEKSSDEATLWLALITSMTVAFAFIFSFVGGWVSERFGRKAAILVSSVVFTIGAVVMAVAPHKAVLLVGRIVVGMGIGMASMCIPVYMAETSPVELRGFLGASFQVMICFGQIISAIVDGAFGEVDDGWKYDFGLAGIPSMILLIGFLFCPESPRWLVQGGKVEEAKKALERLRGKDVAIDKELQEIEAMVAEDKKIEAMTEGSVFKRAWNDSNVRKALLVGCSLQLFQQLIGINTVIYYSARILLMSGISNDMSQILWLNALVQATCFFASFIGMALIDRMGRRVLCLSSYVGVLISLLIIGAGFQLSESNTTAANTTKWESDLPESPPIYNQCAKFADCNACTDEYDDFNCGFCYLEDGSPNGQGSGSCVPWEWPADSKEPLAVFGRCNSYNSTEKDESGAIFAAEYCKTRFSPMILVGLLAYLIAFQAGVGPVPWVYNPEIYPLWFRSTGVSMSTGFNWSLNLIVSFTFPYLQQGLGFGAYYFFAGMAGIALTWFSLVLPETKGKTLEEMNSSFGAPLWRLGRT